MCQIRVYQGIKEEGVMSKIVTFGEIMLRLKSPGHERLFQSPVLEATFGGGEANVAVGLSHFGLEACYVSIIPESAVGDACIAELRRQGIDTSAVIRKGERLGAYFLETGANQRPSRVLYDREHSGIAEIAVGDVDWNNVFSDASWFHISGITPAISSTAADVSIEAVKAAKRMKLTVSCDLNHRKKLWKYGKSAPEIMVKMLDFVDVAIGNEEDCQKSLGIETDIDVEAGALSVERYEMLTRTVLERFPSLQKIAITMRESISADYNNWQAVLNNRKDFFVSKKYEIHDIVDRVGSGDTFAAGLIYGLNVLDTDSEALEFAAAAGCLMHTIPGDLPLLSSDEVKALAEGKGSGRVQR